MSIEMSSQIIDSVAFSRLTDRSCETMLRLRGAELDSVMSDSVMGFREKMEERYIWYDGNRKSIGEGRIDFAKTFWQQSPEEDMCAIYE